MVVERVAATLPADQHAASPAADPKRRPVDRALHNLKAGSACLPHPLTKWNSPNWSTSLTFGNC